MISPFLWVRNPLAPLSWESLPLTGCDQDVSWAVLSPEPQKGKDSLPSKPQTGKDSLPSEPLKGKDSLPIEPQTGKDSLPSSCS